MKIHILDTNEEQFKAGSMINANCGEEVIFDPIGVQWDDGRVCDECLRLHRVAPQIHVRHTFAFAKP